MHRLHFNENPYGVSEIIKEKALREIQNLQLQWYPDREAAELREALADYAGVSSDRGVVANGSDDILQMVLMAHLDEIDRVVIPVPTFGMYRKTAEILGLQVSEVPLDENSQLDVPGLKKEIDRGPAAVFICHPNNPTGNYFSSEDIEALINTEAPLVIIDEAYFEFGGRTSLERTENDPRVVVVRTLSKAFGLAGVRVGYLLGHPDAVQEIEDIRQPYNMSASSQVFAKVAVQNAQAQLMTVEKMIKQREVMRTRLSEIPGLNPLPSVTNFFLVKVDQQELGLTAEKLQKRLKEQGVWVRFLTGVPDCIRVSVGLPGQVDDLIGEINKIRNKE